MTADELDDLVAEWHECPEDTISLFEFLQDHTGWNYDQFEYWVITGEIPN